MLVMSESIASSIARFLANIVLTAECCAASLTLWRNSGHVLDARIGVPNSLVKEIICILEDLACSTHNSSCSKGHFSVARSFVSTAINVCRTIQDRTLLLLFCLQNIMRVEMESCA